DSPTSDAARSHDVIAQGRCRHLAASRQLREHLRKIDECRAITPGTATIIGHNHLHVVPTDIEVAFRACGDGGHRVLVTATGPWRLRPHPSCRVVAPRKRRKPPPRQSVMYTSAPLVATRLRESGDSTRTQRP